MELLHSLDWGEVLAQALPPPTSMPGTPPTPSGGSVFTLLDADEDEAEREVAGDATAQGPLAHKDQPLWAAELGAVVLQAAVLLPHSELPHWMLDVLGDGQYTDPSIVALLASADWGYLRAIIGVTSPLPWLAAPLFQVSQQASGGTDQRVVDAALVLCRAAERRGTAIAAETACAAVRPLIGLSMCQGYQVEQGQPRPSAPAAPAHELLSIPSDIPPELLEGTVELEQMRLQQEELRLAHEQAEAAAAAAAAEGPAGSGMPLIEVSSCFRLSAQQHLMLVQQGLGPLAREHAAGAALKSITGERCPAFLEAVPPSTTAAESGVVHWSPSPLGSLLQAQKASTASYQANSGGNKGRSASRASSDVASVFATLLAPLVSSPLTLIVQERIPFGNATLPWDTDAALFITSGGGGAPLQQSGRSMRALRQQLSTLLRLGNDEAPVVDPAAELNRVLADLPALRNLLVTLVEEACRREDPSGSLLASCLLREVMLFPPLQESVASVALAENLLRRLASPPAVAASIPPPSAANYGAPLVQFAPSDPAVVPVMAASNLGTTVTQLESSVEAEMGRPGINDRGIVLPTSMQQALSAASGIPATSLVAFGRSCAALKRPLLCAFVLERGREAALTMDKAEWQALVTQVLESATSADSNAEHPLELVAVWLEVLNWLEGKRWRALPPGKCRAFPHAGRIHLSHYASCKFIVLLPCRASQSSADQLLSSTGPAPRDRSNADVREPRRPVWAGRHGKHPQSDGRPPQVRCPSPPGTALRRPPCFRWLGVKQATGVNRHLEALWQHWQQGVGQE